ncbi:hypothetical protein FBD94_15430 [Pedobacter hiemivivus]|uniref:HTH domain-containing protein n=1 Tax=Pedobacter hiemivivus TaxID=2530454 RepID=A0A4U1G8V9_9SPHI|nr:hypothetical protein [Pedobacter hiemivivus]TKC60295.1 hypothetical protein FBD94_15430 [Pedobacter hiemivivus]
MKVDLTLLKRIHECILKETTGSPDFMAEKLGISKRFLHVILDYLKSEFDAPIAYSRLRETYYYTEEWEFYIGDLKRIKSELIKGVLETIHNTVRIAIVIGVMVF